MKKAILLVITVTSVFSFFTFVNPLIAQSQTSIEPVELKMWSAWSPHTWATNPNMQWFMDTVNRHGKDVNLSIKYIGGPEVFPGFEGVTAIGKGLIDVAFTAGSYNASVVPEGLSMILSELSPWEERETGAYDLMDKFHQKKANIKYLYRLAFDGYFALYLKEKRTTLDLKGLKLRTGGVDYDWLVRALGGTPVIMKPPDVLGALQRGIINGYGWPSAGIADRGWHEGTKYVFGPNFGSCPTGIFLNLDRWENLHEEQRAFLTNIAREMEHHSLFIWKAFMDKDRKLLKAHGIEEIKFSPADEKKYLELFYDASWEGMVKEAPDSAPLRKLVTR